MAVSRRHFIQTMTTSAIGLCLLSLPWNSSGFQASVLSKDEDIFNEERPSDASAPKDTQKSSLAALPLLYDF